MKKTIGLLFIIFISYFAIAKVIESKDLIPEEAIRMRIIPNSNSQKDQLIKGKIKKEVENNIFDILKDTKGIEEAREKIKNEIPLIDKNIKNVLEMEKYPIDYQINYGKNYFPEKVYKGITYKAGNYESLVITLGKGEGDNWWCVLFPPLCLIEADESDEVEYKLFVEELIKKYL